MRQVNPRRQPASLAGRTEKRGSVKEMTSAWFESEKSREVKKPNPANVWHRPDYGTEESEREQLVTLSKACNLLGVQGEISSTYGKYLAGCRQFDQQGWAMVEVKRLRNGRLDFAVPMSRIFGSFELLQEWVKNQVSTVVLVDEANDLTPEGDRVWNYLEGLQSPDAVFHALQVIHPAINQDWWDWTH